MRRQREAWPPLSGAWLLNLALTGFAPTPLRPATVKTGITELADPETVAKLDEHFARNTPIPRPGTPEDFEGIAAYLCSDASAYHSGNTIVIDGGSLVHAPYAF